jgi:hypothetical protein
VPGRVKCHFTVLASITLPSGGKGNATVGGVTSPGAGNDRDFVTGAGASTRAPRVKQSKPRRPRSFAVPSMHARASIFVKPRDIATWRPGPGDVGVAIEVPLSCDSRSDHAIAPIRSAPSRGWQRLGCDVHFRPVEENDARLSFTSITAT